ncbi:hypothetical protein [Spirosoma linguale]|uniref:Uncharacterized protein n=1 Tax=Spirosoma linguale (strain ATCC 33905 / DSM 74 / LMG 10896 / Claus 1) TaxID=504472 RepID=D2QR12_SPILD|nr:hypothetical protein Slin_1819 [Spirosoma linguale DSM 74]
MDVLSKEAANTYIILTSTAYDDFLITEEIYWQRLHILKQLCDPTDADFIANLDLHISFFSKWRVYKEEDLYIYPLDNATDSIEDQESEKADFQGNDYDPLLHFITDKGGKMGRWEFHKTDSDFFPSIPHGHALSNHKIKLDAYSGHMYKNDITKSVDRESRRYIIDLWNDERFRKVARETITYYMETFRSYRWPVANPLRLPRRRYWAL